MDSNSEEMVENRDQAQALANFLWNERERHRDDIDQIEEDLKVLEEKWNVTPLLRRVYVRPEVGGNASEATRVVCGGRSVVG